MNIDWCSYNMLGEASWKACDFWGAATIANLGIQVQTCAAVQVWGNMANIILSLVHQSVSLLNDDYIIICY